MWMKREEIKGALLPAILAQVPEVEKGMKCDFSIKEYRATGVGARAAWHFRHDGEMDTRYPWVSVYASLRYGEISEDFSLRGDGMGYVHIGKGTHPDKVPAEYTIRLG